MHSNLNPNKEKQREAAWKAKVTGLNRALRRSMKKEANRMSQEQKPIKSQKVDKIRHPVPYRANLDSPHNEVIPEPKRKDELERGWDSPAPKAAWKKQPPKAG